MNNTPSPTRPRYRNPLLQLPPMRALIYEALVQERGGFPGATPLPPAQDPPAAAEPEAQAPEPEQPEEAEPLPEPEPEQDREPEHGE